jgi:hypothetical protein
LQRQIESNYPKNIIECNNILKEFSSFINQLCDVAESSKVEYTAENSSQKLVFIE